MTTAIETSPLKITRHDAPNAALCDLGRDRFRLDKILTAECGAISGSIWRHIDDDTEDGLREVLYEVRLDGSDETGGFSNWCACTPPNLIELARVAMILEAEWEALQ
jgi:hypothetical protein